MDNACPPAEKKIIPVRSLDEIRVGSKIGIQIGSIWEEIVPDAIETGADEVTVTMGRYALFQRPGFVSSHYMNREQPVFPDEENEIVVTQKMIDLCYVFSTSNS
jgi:hypothetical protein